MEERKFVKLKKEEFGIKEYIKRDLGKSKISNLDMEYTPVGEKIIISTSKPGLVIGRKGEKIGELTEVLKKRFKLENPHIEIKEIENPLFNAQIVADDIALALERMGNLRFKVIAYKKLQEIMRGGALGCELRITGKLPSDRAKSWRFAEGYLKKAGEPKKEMNRAQATALTKTGIIGVKVIIMPPKAKIYDKIDIDEKIKNQIKEKIEIKSEEERVKEIKKTGKKPKTENISAKETKVKKTKILKKTEFRPEEGRIMEIEEKIEEGVPEDIIESELKEEIKKELKK